MFTKITSATISGIDGVDVSVEIDVARGIPAIDIVGLPEMSVKESRDRVRAAIRNAGFEFPVKRITINLAPANLKKEGSGFDLPIAIGIMAAAGYVACDNLSDCAFLAELSLEGRLRGVNGMLPMALALADAGIKRIFVAPENAHEVAITGKVTPVAAETLSDVVAYLRGEKQPVPVEKLETEVNETAELLDFADVQGQFQGKRALEIAAAGGHNVIMTGPPGTGKTMLARRITTILPPLTDAESLSVTKIYSVAGLLKNHGSLLRERPFRAPHHTASDAALIGGGRVPRPGEVTLSHNGVLFLDEFPEFAKNVIEVLRQPLEDGDVTISRVNATMTYPAQFMLVAAMNPCACGYRNDGKIACRCTDADIKKYERRISGPLLDRIDIAVEVPRLDYEDFVADKTSETSVQIRRRVISARALQTERFKNYGIACNALMGHNHIKLLCKMSKNATELLKQAYESMRLSARAYDRIIKTARTIADLENEAMINETHIAEAIQLRPKKYIE
ncbi:MAG: YifB family Mg chelatase-like AAA ATPase [Negativicutes bacterium]|jgi:magnesium chelatase family protein